MTEDYHRRTQMSNSELFVVEHKESGQSVSVYGFAANRIAPETLGGAFLIYTSDGWDFRSVEEFVPFRPKKLKLEEEKE